VRVCHRLLANANASAVVFDAACALAGASVAGSSGGEQSEARAEAKRKREEQDAQVAEMLQDLGCSIGAPPEVVNDEVRHADNPEQRARLRRLEARSHGGTLRNLGIALSDARDRQRIRCRPNPKILKALPGFRTRLGVSRRWVWWRAVQPCSGMLSAAARQLH
jgi:hypothetical protein